MPRFSCAACGPASLRGDGSRRLKQFECSECSNEDGKFDSSDFDKYVLCLNESCRRKISRSCMHDLVKSSKQAHSKKKIGEEREGEEQISTYRDVEITCIVRYRIVRVVMLQLYKY